MSSDFVMSSCVEFEGWQTQRDLYRARGRVDLFGDGLLQAFFWSFLPYYPFHESFDFGQTHRPPVQAHTRNGGYVVCYVPKDATVPVIICIRGTKSLSEVKTDLMVMRRKFSTRLRNDLLDGDKDYAKALTKHAHDGFVHNALEVLLALKEHGVHLSSATQVRVYGHSLGGATALVLSHILIHRFGIGNVRVRVIAAPAMGRPDCLVHKINTRDYVHYYNERDPLIFWFARLGYVMYGENNRALPAPPVGTGRMDLHRIFSDDKSVYSSTEQQAPAICASRSDKKKASRTAK